MSVPITEVACSTPRGVTDFGGSATDGVLRLGLVARPDDEAVVATTDVGPLGDDVERGAVAVGREEADRVALGLAVVADLLGQADRGQRAADTEALVVGDGRPLDRVAEASGLFEGVAQVLPGGVVEGDADGDVGGVVADAALGDGLAEGFFEQDGVGDDLEAVGGPGGGRAARRLGWPRLCS